MNSHFFHVEGVAAAVAVLGFAGTSVRLIYSRWKQYDETVEFVGAMKHNHLPHIYRALQVISFHLGVSPDELEPPPSLD